MSFIKDQFFGGAEKKAAQARVAGMQQGIDEQQQFRDQLRGDYLPSLEQTGLARTAESDFLGLNGPEAEQAWLDSYIESPGQAFLRERQERALLRNSSALGGLRGGNVLTALQEQAYGIAGQQLGERKNRLSGVVNRGSADIANYANQGAGVSANIANMYTGQGDARAQGIIGRKNAIGGTLTKIAGAFTGTGGLGAVGGGGLAAAPVAGVSAATNALSWPGLPAELRPQ